MRYILLCLFATLLLPLYSAGQAKPGQALLDSMLAEVPKMREDTAGVKLLNNIASLYRLTNPNDGVKWASRGLALAQKISWRKGQALAYYALGANYQFIGAYPEALNAFFQTLHIDEELGDKKAAGKILMYIGSVYFWQNDYPKALEYEFKSLKIAEEQGDKNWMQGAMNSIGGAYLRQGKYKEALVYELKSLHLAEELNNKPAIIIATSGIGNVYSSLNQYPSALAYGFKALRIAQEIGDMQSLAANFGNIGEYFYLIAADSVAPKPDSLVPASRAANLSKAIEYLNKGIAVSREIDLKEGVVEFSNYLSKALALQGDYKGALAAYQTSKNLQDSLHNAVNSKEITALETKRAADLKDKDIQIEKLKKRNERILSISGFAVLLLILGVLIYNFRKQRHSNQLLSREKKRSDDLLLNILPLEVAEELKASGGSKARQFDDVTVLFTDFVNFTGTAELLGPQTLVKELHECFTAFDAIIEKNGLEKIKTVGDAYIAVCGLPHANHAHAKKCVQAAIDILHFIEERSKKEQTFAIRIGINSGSVVAGIVGVKKFAYDIWGDTVNTAARMEQNGEPGRVNISQSTYELVKDDYECDYRGAVAAKNKGDIPMYFVEEPATAIA